jgi:16S rRNA (cytosine967-C5)-methyltransferase
MPSAPANPRGVALQLLRAVLERGQALDAALAENPRFAALAPRDRSFARLLVVSLLRRLGQLDAAIDHCLERPLKPKLAAVRDLLRLGAVQLLFLETPPHAAVSTTMALARHPRLAGQKGLINAVLRRLSREGADLVAAQDAARLNTPDWLWESWAAAYGEARARAIAEIHLVEPPLDLSVKRDPETWAQTLAARLLPGGSLRLSSAGGEITRLAGFEAGAWWVQDAAAALPARLLGQVDAQSIVDLCAAPGGKTAQLAAAGARVTAVDHSPVRLKRLEANLQRLGLDATTVVADARRWRPDAMADAVLLDAPCSATGTIRRHPDIARLKTPDAIAPLARLQDELLDAAVEMVRPGGRIVYAVCSLQPEEAQSRIQALLARRAAVARLPLDRRELPGLEELISPEGDLRSLPCHLADCGGMDGFYACRLTKI